MAVRTRKRGRAKGRRYPIRERTFYDDLVEPKERTHTLSRNLGKGQEKRKRHQLTVSHHFGKRIQEEPYGLSDWLGNKRHHKKTLRAREEEKRRRIAERANRKKHPYNFDFVGDDPIGSAL